MSEPIKHNMTVKQLRAIAKERGFKEYYKINEAELEDYINGKITIEKKEGKKTVKHLRAEAKKKTLKGYSKINKADLQKYVDEADKKFKFKYDKHLQR